MKTFDHIAIIYNPGSTGEAPRLARKFRSQLHKYGLSGVLVPTKYPAHAIEIARARSLKYKRPLLVSVSGDGGYNEVIQGAMEAKDTSETATPVTAVIAAGNANDHKRVTRGSTPLIELVRAGDIKTMDVLRVTIETEQTTTVSYAHSYVGLGLTSFAGKILNDRGKGLINEVSALYKTFRKFKPFTATINGRTRAYDNIIFGNINEMAKIVKLHDSITLNDGKFDVIIFRHHGVLRLLIKVISTALFGVRHSRPASTFTLTIPKKTSMQLDGEVTQIPAGSTLTVASIQSGIETLY